MHLWVMAGQGAHKSYTFVLRCINLVHVESDFKTPQ